MAIDTLGSRRREHGIALISVVGVLVLLGLIVTPFVMTLRDSAARGDRVLYSARVEADAESVFGLVRGHLASCVESAEYGNAVAARSPWGRLALVAGEKRTPDFDTPGEFSLPPELLERFRRPCGNGQRVWSVDVVDQQSVLDLNGCSYPVLANLLGRTRLTEDIDPHDRTLHVEDASAFPERDGVIRVGGEVIRYAVRSGRQFLDCTRGVRSDRPENGAPGYWESGDTVVSEAAFEITTRPFQTRPGAYVRYTNPYQARQVSELGVAALTPEQFDRLRPFVSTWSGTVAGDGWCDAQALRGGVSADDKGPYLLTLGSTGFFGPGTVVKVTDGAVSDYGVVTKVVGDAQVLVSGAFRHGYSPDLARVYARARSPLNLNTVRRELLILAWTGLRLRGSSDDLDEREATALVDFLMSWTPSDAPGPGIYRNWRDFVAALDAARNEPYGIIGADEYEAVLRNAINANDGLLAFSTVPLCFRSFDLYEVRATVSLLDAQGQEQARRELRRVVSASSARTEIATVESQDDFQRQIMRSRDGKWFATWPVNVNAHHEGKIIPAPEYTPFAQRERFPSTARTSTEGDVRLLPARFDFDGRDDRHFHFDGSELHDGLDVGTNAFVLSLEGPYDPQSAQVDLIERVEINGGKNPRDAGLHEFTLSFLYQPGWGRDGRDHTILDYGYLRPNVNRVSLRYDGARDMLVLAVADAALEEASAEVYFDFDGVTWEAEQWYHLGIHVGGASSDELELFVDGEKVGRASQMTRLTADIPGDGELSVVAVEDTSTFPINGVLYVQGDFGAELIEYRGRSQNLFNVHRRKARSIDDADQALEFRPHRKGAVVQLYGFSGLLQSDLTKGGARLEDGLGPWRMYRMTASGDAVRSCFIDAADATTDALPPGAVPSQRCPQPPADTNQLAYEVVYQGLAQVDGYHPVITIEEWDTRDDSPKMLDDLGGIGAEGIALIASPIATVRDDDGFLFVDGKGNVLPGSGTGGGGGTGGVGSGSGGGGGAVETVPSTIGGVDIVRYRVETVDTQNGLRVRILEGGLDLVSAGSESWVKHGGGSGRFFPQYSYGARDQDPFAIPRTGGAGSSVGSDFGGGLAGATAPELGFWTSFIPIGIVARGTNTDYLDPAREEPQLDDGTGDRYAYVQIGTEWVKYDMYDEHLVPGGVTFCRDAKIGKYLDELFENAGQALQHLAPQTEASGRSPGGSGGPDAGGLAPPSFVDTNFESGDPYQPVPKGTGAGGGGLTPGAPAAPLPGTYLDPPVDALAVARRLDFRGHRSGDEFVFVANTRPRDHAKDEVVVPAFKVLSGDDIENGPAARGAYPGYDDLLTFRSRVDDEYRTEQQRVRWGYKGWAALTDESIQTWGWDRFDAATPSMKGMRLADPRIWTRTLKFPSGEMPDGELTRERPDLVFGRPFDKPDEATAGTVDELVFPEMRGAERGRPLYAHLGAVPRELQSFEPPDEELRGKLKFAGIDDEATDIPVHEGHYRAVPKDATVREIVSGYDVLELFATDGGVIRIDEELIYFEDFDEHQGKFTGCLRGVFGTEPRAHEYNAKVLPISTFPATRLLQNVNEDGAYFKLENLDDFPDAGYLRIADANEVIGYTRHDDGTAGARRGAARNGGTALLEPLRRIDPTTPSDDPDDDARVGGALFRGRFATEPETYKTGDIAIALPFRVWDRYADLSDDPENSFVQLSWTRPGAIWKRVTWKDVPEEFTEVLALVRFSGGPPWDSTDVVRVGQENIPPGDRSKHLYLINRPEELNLLNVPSDRIEVRLMVRFDQGAYDRRAEERPNHWKNSPWIQRVRVESVAPSLVIYQE